ncbi:hypothetical protein CTAYLR_006102 [Chrysophaeum taylorii]|uniref:Protein-lysine N-methyltransferase CTAYLR_006102 n=1 Tax=Chrysophaeum taylorii TaxID=2483200 RepID=A0AAD7U9H8_9STRA|nr:hypothetical protein CTAYLR_006102 [Chrysophaeum taylorii]
MDDDEKLSRSELGTKAYWESHYERERANLADSGDTGVDWFAENIGDTLVAWLCEELALENVKDMIDLGCGNGAFLFEVERRSPWERLVGVDYCDDAIALAKAVAEENGSQRVTFRVANLEDDVGSFSIVHDKGTFDAYMLGTGTIGDYRAAVLRALRPGGYLVITSCNSTVSELVDYFRGSDLAVLAHIPYPTIAFGGHTGATVATVAFQHNQPTAH